MTVRAKLTVTKVEKVTLKVKGGTDVETVRSVRLASIDPAVEPDNAELAAFRDLTDGVTIVFSNINKANEAEFEEGKQFLVDFTPVA